MKQLNDSKITLLLFVSVGSFSFGIVLIHAGDASECEGMRPNADSGQPRYAATEPVQLDGSKSYDPDNSGTLSYTWRQIDGPSVVITNANTATPTISSFLQTDEIQTCEFELVVSDSELTSLPDMVKVIIVPALNKITMVLENSAFDPEKPTIVYFGGGDCKVGFPDQSWSFPVWSSKANIIGFPSGYVPDVNSAGLRTYYRYGDMIIVYLSALAPDYKQPIQTMGWSTGGQPAVDVGLRLNMTYQDARYAVNRITLLDATGYCRDYSESIKQFLASSVDSEPCWLDNYASTLTGVHLSQHLCFHPNVLNIGFEIRSHILARQWYGNSVADIDMDKFNNGIIAGAYWSVIGPGRNLQLASTPDTQTYKFMWYGIASAGHMDFYDEPNYPGRLPEPVTLIGPVDVGDPNGAVLTCQESENAISYQLLFGTDPYRVMDYNIISDTSAPPNEVISTLPFDETWWTVRVRDQYGSTIYADPRCVDTHILSLPIENMTTGERYGYIQDAIDDGAFGDEIVITEGIYLEYINFQGKNLIVRSADPNDSSVVAATILMGDGKNNLVTFSDNENASCVLAGLTITDSNNGVFCSAASPTIINCKIVANVTAGMKLCMGSSPTISNSIIARNSGAGIAMFIFKSGRTLLINSPTISNCTIVHNSEIGISEGIPTVLNSIIYGNDVQIRGSSAAVKYSNVQGGFTGEGNIDADPLFADPMNGDYHLKSLSGRWNPLSGSWVIDEITSLCIDTGDPSMSAGAELEPNGARINMGAYGETTEASKSQ